MMLEIINSCLSNSLHHNPNLVYALLYKRELFEQFRSHPSFQDIMQNLDTVSTHTHTRPHAPHTPHTHQPHETAQPPHPHTHAHSHARTLTHTHTHRITYFPSIIYFPAS